VGSADDVVVAEVMTGADGSYLFAGIPAGDYTVVVDRSTLPWAVQNTFDPDGILDGTTPVTVLSGQVADDNDFGYVGAFNVRLSKTVVGEPAMGADIEFTITVTNDGPATALGPITVLDTVPDQLSVADVMGADWDCSVDGQTVECVLDGDLGAGESAVVLVNTIVARPIHADVTNTASVAVTGPVPEPDLTDNTDSATVGVSELPHTGADLLRFAIMGLLLLAAGAALVAMSRQRNERRETVD